MGDEAKLEKFITKANLRKALSRLLKDVYLVGPVRPYAEAVFQQVKSADDIVFDYENCLNAPKDYILSNDEVLFEYDLKPTGKCAGAVREGEISKGREVVIFGSRPCDTKAVGLLDKFFSRNFEDPLYFKKRNNILIITLACKKLGQRCFCTSTNSGPYLEGGFDVQLVDIGTGFLLEADSSKGKDFVRGLSDLTTDIDAAKKGKGQEVKREAAYSKGEGFDLKAVYDNLDRLNTREGLWQDLSQRCQGCGGCLLICPTCSCFYVVDKRTNGKEGQRVRSLDGCFYEGLTRMAGGYNPIAPKEAMMRRKFYHKLWQQVNEFEQAGCTGCGRCSEICPGNINWLDVIKRIEKAAV